MDSRFRFAKIVVTFERRDDGGLRAYSDDVPGFVLSHHDARAVVADVKPALETILSEMLHSRVLVEPLPSLADELEEAGIINEIPTKRRTQREYVGQLAAA